MQPTNQPAPVAGPVARQPGHRDAPGAAAADPDDRGDPAPPPGPGPRRPHRLAGLVFEDDPAAEGRRRAFIRGQVSFFHTSTAPSSRSIARRAPSWQVQPRRCSRYQIPGMVYRSLNFVATRSRTRAGVHRWSSQPAASGPASSARSSAASCRSSSRHCAACLREVSPVRPLASQASRYRRTDRSLTRSSAAITADGTHRRIQRGPRLCRNPDRAVQRADAPYERDRRTLDRGMPARAPGPHPYLEPEPSVTDLARVREPP